MKRDCGYVCEFSNNTNCKTDLLLSHHTRVYMVGGYMVGGYMEGHTKPQNCQNWWVGACTEMGACLGQYGNKKNPACSHG